jgi:alkylated DNA repair dioxygenase AlkB
MSTGHQYEKDFLSKEEADALFAVAKTLPSERPLTKLSGFKNRLRRLQMPCYSVTPNWRGSENEKTNQWMMPLDEAPAEVKSLAEKLSELAGKPVNYLSFVGYENEKDHIGWHQHGEDKCRDARVFIISLGEARTFGIRKLCDECRVCDNCNELLCAGETKPSCERCKQAHKHRKTCEACNDKIKWTLLQPVHGSLIRLPNEYNNTHEHAVLDDKGPKGFRVSINTKHISPEDIAAGNGYIPKEHRHGGPTSKTEVVHCMKDQYDIYIGRRNNRAGLPESPFANRSDGDYETYFRAKLLHDPTFAGQVLKCHGKKLGCWCKGTSRDFSQCHGHIVAKWADVIAAKWEELRPNKVAMRSWLNEEVEKGGK